MNNTPSHCTVAVSYGINRRGVPAAVSFTRWANAACQGRTGHAEMAIRVVDTHEARMLNNTYRHKDYATNVLSFPADLPESLQLPLLGDLVLCAPVIAQEALAQHKTLNAHYAHLVIHGVLHLLGFNHEHDAEAEWMETLEREILAGLGIADPY